MKELIEKNLRGDRIIWGLIFALSLFSLLAVYSSTRTLAYKFHGGNTAYYLFKHLTFLIAGFTITILVHRLNYKFFSRMAVILLWSSIGLLLVTLVIGNNLNQASRWLTIPGTGLAFQPSEFAKLALVVYIARILSQHQEEGVSAAQAFKPIVFYLGIVCGLIITENLSTAVMIGFVSMVLMFIGRVPVKYLFASGFVAILLVVVIVFIAPYVKVFHRAATWKARIERFITDDKTEVESEGDYQSNQAKIAIATGGIFGKGPGNSYQCNFLPHPYSDFIYAIIIEEFGFVGGFLVLLIYLTLLFRAAILVRNSQRTFPAFMAMGLTFILVMQAFINMGVAVGMFPVTGQTLPLVSMGGTSILFTSAAFGAILSVSRCVVEESEGGDKNVVKANVKNDVVEDEADLNEV